VADAVEKLLGIPLVGRVIRHRFFKFGAVGFSGTVINLLVLYANQEVVFRSIYPAERRLYVSLAGAIFVATLSNFIWNRKWTWEDRKGKTNHGVVVQLGQYFLACGVAISVQYLFTILLSRVLYYVAANLLSIGIAAMINYALNDLWTFALAKKVRLQEQNRERKIRRAEAIGKR